MRKFLSTKILNLIFVFTLSTLALGAVGPFAPTVLAQTRLKPGMNLFSMRDEIAVGQRSAAQVESQYRSYNDARVSRIGHRLASRSSMPGLPWRFRVINRSDVNAFALPGGPVYVTTGMLRAARSDSELAGVLAHEITHVTLRHGTNQASKAMLARMPLQLLAGRLGGGLGGNLARLGIGFGLNSVLLRYSRDAEKQADVGAVQLMRRSGYDPRGLSSFMRTLKGRGGFFSDHPSPSDRVERIEREIGMTSPNYLRGKRR